MCEKFCLKPCTQPEFGLACQAHRLCYALLLSLFCHVCPVSINTRTVSGLRTAGVSLTIHTHSALSIVAVCTAAPMHLWFAASTQAASAVLVAFQAVGLREELQYMMLDHWAMLGIQQVSHQQA